MYFGICGVPQLPQYMRLIRDEKKYKIIKNILNKFSNKTFQMQNHNNSFDGKSWVYKDKHCSLLHFSHDFDSLNP